MHFDFTTYDLSSSQLLELYKSMLKSRMIEEKMLILLRQGRISKWFSGMGQEAIASGIALAMNEETTLAGTVQAVDADRPFQIGDWVQFGSVEGTVEEVGFRSTRVRTFAKTVVSIPNQALANATVENHSLMPKRRIKFKLGVTYAVPNDNSAFIRKAIEDVDEAYHALARARRDGASDSELEGLKEALAAAQKAADEFIETNEFGGIIEQAGGSGLNASTGAQ